MGDGARHFPIPAADLQYACSNRNFANRIEAYVLCCHDNPNLRVTPREIRGSGGWAVSTNREKMSFLKKKKKKKRQACINVPDEKQNQVAKFYSLYHCRKPHNIRHICAHLYYTKESLCFLSQERKNKPLQRASMTVHPPDYLSTDALEAVLASDIYSCIAGLYPK